MTLDQGLQILLCTPYCNSIYCYMRYKTSGTEHISCACNVIMHMRTLNNMKAFHSIHVSSGQENKQKNKRKNKQARI